MNEIDTTPQRRYQCFITRLKYPRIRNGAGVLRYMARKKKKDMGILFKRVPLRLKAELQKLVEQYLKDHE